MSISAVRLKSDIKKHVVPVYSLVMLYSTKSSKDVAELVVHAIMWQLVNHSGTIESWQSQVCNLVKRWQM